MRQKKQIPEVKLQHPSEQKVLSAVCSEFNVFHQNILLPRKFGLIPDARHAAIYILRSFKKYREIAVCLNITMSAVVNARRAAINKYETDAEFRIRFDSSLKKLHGELFPCPYNNAVSCNLKEGCLACETFSSELIKQQEA